MATKKTGNSKGNSKSRKPLTKTQKKAIKRGIKKLPIAVVIVIALVVSAYFILNYLGYSIEDLLYPKPAPVPREPLDGKVYVHVIDVGQGDSILIEAPDGVMLIDAGTSSSRDTIETYLEAKGIETIDYFVLTHAHYDHTGAADRVFDEFEIKNVIYEDYGYGSSFYTDVTESGANVIDPSPRDEYYLGDVVFTVLSPDPTDDYGTDENNYSVVLRMDYGGSSFIFSGDATKKVEKRIMEEFSESELDCDFLKSPHHGSDTSSGSSYIETLSPEIIAISVGAGNTYNLPKNSVLETYEDAGATIYRTDYSGTLVFMTDGATITYVEAGQ